MAQSPTTAKRGRPPLLTKKQAVHAASSILAELPLEAFTMANVAERLSVAPMTLYGYFPSRDALLQAVAEEVFSTIDVSTVRQIRDWRERVRLWCYLIYKQLSSQPHLSRLICEPTQLLPAWQEIATPMIEALRDAHLTGEQPLHFAQWLSRNVVAAALFESFLSPAVEFRDALHRQDPALISAAANQAHGYVLGLGDPLDADALIEISIDSWVRTIERAADARGDETHARELRHVNQTHPNN